MKEWTCNGQAQDISDFDQSGVNIRVQPHRVDVCVKARRTIPFWAGLKGDHRIPLLTVRQPTMNFIFNATVKLFRGRRSFVLYC
jgi:hypothetical protein